MVRNICGYSTSVNLLSLRINMPKICIPMFVLYRIAGRIRCNLPVYFFLVYDMQYIHTSPLGGYAFTLQVDLMFVCVCVCACACVSACFP